MRDIWAFAINEDMREIAGRIKQEFAGWELEKLKLQAAYCGLFFCCRKKFSLQGKIAGRIRHSAAGKKIRQKFASAKKSGILYM